MSILSEKPRFNKGETLRTIQYLSPLPRGTSVSVVDVNESRKGFRYLIEGEFRGEKVRVWSTERDLDLPFID